MNIMKPKEKEILEELGALLYSAYEGADGKIAMPSEKGFVDVLEGLRCLSILIRYQRFDIEATRRENEYLQNLLRSR